MHVRGMTTATISVFILAMQAANINTFNSTSSYTAVSNL